MKDRADNIRNIKSKARLRRVSPVVRPVKEIAKRGASVKPIFAQLKKLYPLFLRKHPVCAIGSPDCTVIATCVHHKKGRGKNEILDQSTWMPACENCNLYVEVNDKWARERGFKISRHKKQMIMVDEEGKEKKIKYWEVIRIVREVYEVQAFTRQEALKISPENPGEITVIRETLKLKK